MDGWREDGVRGERTERRTTRRFSLSEFRDEPDAGRVLQTQAGFSQR